MSAHTDKATQWIYHGLWSVLVQWFRVPDKPPTLPTVGDDVAESFRPAEGFLRYMKFRFWIALLIIDIAIMGGWLIGTIALWRNDLLWVGLLLLPPVLIIAIVPDIIAFVAIHLRYDTTWYVMTGRSLRIRRGVWTIQETTISFENVQNVKVHSGPLQRYYGIANLEVETAGSGGSAGSSQQKGMSNANRGIIEGVTNALELRDKILARLRQSQSAGLGDEPDEELQKNRIGWTPAHLQMLGKIRQTLAHWRAEAASQ